MSIELCDIKKTFSQKTVIERFSFRFPDQGLYGILGASGSGKTTLLRIIAGLDAPTDGTVKIRGNVSFAFQEYRLFPHLDAVGNVKKILTEKPDENTDKQLTDFLFDLGFTENDMHLFPAQLSGGMKQRVNLARAVLFPSSVLLLDEPFKELDENLAKKVARILEKESEKRLVIFAMHEPRELFKIKPNILFLNEKARQ